MSSNDTARNGEAFSRPPEGSGSLGVTSHDETLAAKMKIGRYQIIEQLGRGAMGVVYKAYDPTIARTVAIKAIRLAEFADVDERHRVQERILREAQSAGLLSHPSIVTIYDVLEEESSAYIFMEFVRGRSLDNLMRDGHLPPVPELMRYLRQVADALDSAHSRGVIHRDIKPGNIILAEPEPTSEKRAKVADFGVAKFISQDTTHSGTMMGTPSYMSPEQIQGLNSDGRTDQFSLGVVIYELLTAAKPFSGDGLPTLFYQICKVEAKPAHEINRNLSEAVSHVLAKALAKESSDRYGSCLAFVADLENAFAHPHRAIAAAAPSVRPAIVERAAPTASVAEPPVMFAPARRRANQDDIPPHSSLIPRIALIMAVCVGFIIVFYLLRNKSTPPGEQPTPAQQQQPANAAPSQQNQAKPAPAPVTAPPPSNTAQLPPSSTTATVPTYAPKPVPVSAEAAIVTEPPGSEVVVDGRESTTCSAPCTLELPAGRHTATASHDGYDMARAIFTIPDEKNVNISLRKQEGTLVIMTTPPDAGVTVDGKYQGKAPLTLHLSPGAHQLLLTSGENHHEESVTIQNGKIEARSFRW